MYNYKRTLQLASVDYYHGGTACEITIQNALEDGMPVGEGELYAHNTITKKPRGWGPKRESHGAMKQ